MSYAFIIVAFVAITVKLLFMSFSLYFTMKNGEQNVTQVSRHTGDHNYGIKAPTVSLYGISQTKYCYLYLATLIL